MNTQYLEMPDQLISELGANVALTKEMRYAHKVCESGGKLMFHCTMYGGKRYKTTQEQVKKAERLYKQNKDAAIKAIGNKLVFVGMGCNYEARYNDDVCNHRIRTELVNAEGKNFFIEVGTWGNENMRYDHLVDRDLEETYMTTQTKLRSEIERLGGFWRVGESHPTMIEYRKYQSQPYYWFREEYARKLQNAGIKYTNANVLKFVNDVFGCNFKEMIVDYYHLSTDDYKSISPKL